MMEILIMNDNFSYGGTRFYLSDRVIICGECVVVLNGHEATELFYSESLVSALKENGKNVPIG